MRGYHQLAATVVAAVAIAAGAPAQAASPEEVEKISQSMLKNADLKNGEEIYKNGKGEVPACNTCHGEDGMGDESQQTPRLAGQKFVFLLKQLQDFAKDRRKDTTMFVMNRNASLLSLQDRVDVAAYLRNLLEPKYQPVGLKKLKEDQGVEEVGQTHLGKALVLYGRPETGTPACRSCHGYNGRGRQPLYPMIGQQRYTYLVNQLKNWRSGDRTNDPLDQMQKVAQTLSDADIRNVAAYLTSAPPTTPESRRLPSDHPPIKIKDHELSVTP